MRKKEKLFNWPPSVVPLLLTDSSRAYHPRKVSGGQVDQLGQRVVGGHTDTPGAKAPGHRPDMHHTRHGCLPVGGTHRGGDQGSPREERLSAHASP